MTGKLLNQCRYCGLLIPKKRRKEHLKQAHKIKTKIKGWISKHFKKYRRKSSWQKPAVIEIK